MLTVRRREIVPGRIVLGPRKIGRSYARIVSQRDGSGRIEAYDTATRKWMATEAISFSEVWAAPVVSPLFAEQITGNQLDE